MNKELKQRKQTIRQFMREHYTDERLVMLLAHAQSGSLAFMSCCCFIGIPTADHALRGNLQVDGEEHYLAAKRLIGAGAAEGAYMMLHFDNHGRRRRLIPIIKAELRRRERLRTLEPDTCDIRDSDVTQSQSGVLA